MIALIFFHHTIHLDTPYLISNPQQQSLNSINYQVVGVFFVVVLQAVKMHYLRRSTTEQTAKLPLCVENLKCVGLFKDGDRGASIG